MKTTFALSTLLVAHASAAGWHKSGGANLCGTEMDDGSAGFGYCETASEVTEYITQRPTRMSFICDLETYGSDNEMRFDITETQSGPHAVTLDAQGMNGQPGCEYVATGESLHLGNSKVGGWAAAMYYMATGDGSCSTPANTFILGDTDADETSSICISPEGRGDITDPAHTCAEQTFKNSEVKFTIFLQTTGTDYAVPKCAGGAAPTHIGGRFTLDYSKIGAGKVYFNDDTGVTPDSMSMIIPTPVKSITLESGAFSGESLEIAFPVATQHGTYDPTTEKYTMVGDGTITVNAFAGDGDTVYLDFIWPIASVDAVDKYVVFDPTIETSTSVKSAASLRATASLFAIVVAVAAML